MDFATLFKADQCIVGHRFVDKTACLSNLARRAAAILGIDAPIITEGLAHREALGSTGLGAGIALPHARLTAIEKPFAMVMRLREALAFEAVDDQPVDLVCLVLLPDSKTGQHLNVLAYVARRLRENAILDAARAAGDANALYTALTMQR